MKHVKPIALYALTVPALLFGLAAVAHGDDAAAQSGTAGAANETYLGAEPAGAVYAGDLIGTDVVSRVDDEEIGSVSDLILDDGGQIIGVIVGVGGFLGIGEKDVAMSWNAVDLDLDYDGDDHVLRVDADKESLEEAAEYERNN